MIAIRLHLQGDIHQPLHCGFAGDEGGNLVTITYYGNTERLHAIWDTNIIDTMLQKVRCGTLRRALSIFGQVLTNGSFTFFLVAHASLLPSVLQQQRDALAASS